MSRATRQEVLIRSLIEALCLTIRDKLQGQPRQKPKVEAVGAILGTIEELSTTFPLRLNPRGARKVVDVLQWFHETQGGDPEFQIPEVLTAMCLALANHLYEVLNKREKVEVVSRLAQQVQALYDTFDRQVKKLDLLIKGGELADQILAKEI